MDIDLGDLNAFLTVARAGGFREGARLSGGSASALSDAIRRLETRLGVRLFNRTTRSVALTAAGNGLLARLEPALGEVANALDVVNGYRDRPAGTLRLNIPVSAARLALPEIIPAFLAKYPEILLEIITEESFVDLMAEGCDAGIRYDERLEQDMIAIPIGPRKQRFAAAASPDYLARNGTPQHPQDLLDHPCIRGRFASGAMFPWEFEKDDQTLEVAVKGPFIMRPGGGTDLAVDVAKGGIGIIYLFEDWLTPFFKDGSLVPILEEWWPSFPGPKLYYPGRRLVPSPLRAFIDFVRAWPLQK
ncbi:LysR family transcriptional regulator [Thalassospira marina]|uniref:LysR family transcriptional regulator n=1 Tax=Thalassospira marina TaxID=2048283 RepID=A0ABM6QDF2_9PROT|nr:LysR family transcriptional regulator [Thalassospira marina]AUG54594.1 LysR family transcriptional regulator [Thalassospira marina]